jgi:cytochrome c peroxidase
MAMSIGSRKLLPAAALGAVFLIAAMAWLGVQAQHVGRRSAPIAGVRRTIPPSRVRIGFERGLDSLAAAVVRLDSALALRNRSLAVARFRAARIAYKRVEALLTYYSPTAMMAINGPPEEGSVDEAPMPLGRSAAFQVIEAELFAEPGRAPDYRTAAAAAAEITSALRAFRAGVPLLDVSDTATLDAARLEVARVTTLGLAGFDADLSGDAISESAEAVIGVRDAVAELGTPCDDVAALLDSAARNLRSEPRSDHFDRLRFIVHYGSPAARAIMRVRHSLDAKPSASRRTWRAESATPFDSGALDPFALAADHSPWPTPALVALGRRLFADPQLSGPQTRSCASCHVPSNGFTDGRQRAATLPGESGHPLRNTPALINVGFEPALFADQRAASLEDQVRAVLASHDEMRSSAELAAERVRQDTSYRTLVARATQPGGRAADERVIRIALASYLRSLTALDSRFDRAVRGDSTALSEPERRGFNLFMGRGRCATCHFAPLFSGVMAPDFARSELEIIGVPATAAAAHPRVDPDSGRARVDGLPVHEHAFKVPTLRNVALTAPYMHNGVYPTLEAVVDFYNRGGGAGLGAPVPGQTLSSRPLDLSARERAELVAFLRTLTDSASLR